MVFKLLFDYHKTKEWEEKYINYKEYKHHLSLINKAKREFVDEQKRFNKIYGASNSVQEETLKYEIKKKSRNLNYLPENQYNEYVAQLEESLQESLADIKNFCNIKLQAINGDFLILRDLLNSADFTNVFYL